MIVIYAEKASLAKAIAVALKAGNRIAHPKEPVQCLHSQFTSGKILTNNNSIPYQNKIGSGTSPVGHYEFIFNGEKTIICHGVGHLCGLADRTAYGDQYKNWDLSVFPCIPDNYQVVVKDKTKTCFEYVKGLFDNGEMPITVSGICQHLPDGIVTSRKIKKTSTVLKNNSKRLRSFDNEKGSRFFHFCSRNSVKLCFA